MVIIKEKKLKTNHLIKMYIEKGQLDIKKIVEDYSGYVYTVVKNSVKGNLTQEDIEEIIADIFFVLWNNQEKLEIDKPLNAYLVGISRNLIKEKYRKNKITVSLEGQEIQLTDNKDISILCEQNEKMDFIEKTLNSMKKIDIQIFKRYYYASKKVKEIAEELNVSEMQVKTRLHRIRNKIKKEMKKGGYENGR